MKSKVLIGLAVISILLVSAGCDSTTSTSSNSAAQSRENSVSGGATTPMPTRESSELDDQVVKKSTSGICHAPGTTYYARTTNYKSYNSIEECLDSGGRLPLK